MIYIIAYLMFYCLSFYGLQRDWRQSFDADMSDIVMMAICSVFLIGVLVLIINTLEGGLSRIFGRKIILKKY